MRTRSPRMAPPVMGLDGSMATTAAGRPALRGLPDERRHERGLAGAGGTGDTDQVSTTSERIEDAQRSLAGLRAILDLGQQPGQRPTITASRRLG